MKMSFEWTERSKDLKKLVEMGLRAKALERLRKWHGFVFSEITGTSGIYVLEIKAELRRNKDNVAMDGLWYDRYDGYALDVEIAVGVEEERMLKGYDALNNIMKVLRNGVNKELYRRYEEEIFNAIGLYARHLVKEEEGKG